MKHELPQASVLNVPLVLNIRNMFIFLETPIIVYLSMYALFVRWFFYLSFLIIIQMFHFKVGKRLL